MARLSQVDVESLQGKLGSHFAGLKKALGRINTYMKVSAHLPNVTKFTMLLPMVLQREGAGGVLSARIKEMAVLRVSYLNDSPHCIAHNEALGQAAGVTKQQIAAIKSGIYKNSGLFTPRQEAAILWAELVTLNTARARDDVFEHLKTLFTEPEILELTLISAMFNMSNRIMNALHMDITVPDVEKIKGSVRNSPENVRNYLQSLLDNWPEEFPEPSKD